MEGLAEAGEHDFAGPPDVEADDVAVVVYGEVEGERDIFSIFVSGCWNEARCRWRFVVRLVEAEVSATVLRV